MSLKELFFATMQKAAENHDDFWFTVQATGSPTVEIISNNWQNLAMKREYIEGAYTEDLKLKAAPDKIQIMSWGRGQALFINK